ncbi:MAG: HTH domain-containing protein, partial [Polyangiales bacterium]
MTFTEAAVEVLRLTGKPLHYKKITEIAIEKNLLSHVGKTPETTMSSRLATMVKKDRGDAPIIKVKPGVFALRDEALDEEVATDAAEPTDESESEPREEVEALAEDRDSDPGADATSEEESSNSTQDLPGSEVFPEEDDDDELILANLDDDAKDSRRGSRKRRPRRRRERDDGRSASNEPRAAREPREPREPRGARAPRRQPEAPANRAAAAGESVGRDLADSIESTVRGRSRQPKTLLQVAEALIDQGRLSGSAADLAPTLAASIRGDSARRRAAGMRPRFRESNGAVALFEWDHPADAVRAEQDAVRAADRQQDSVRREFVKRLRDLPDGALLELLATWLNAVGVHSIRGVRSESGDFSLAGVLRRGPEETPLAITIYRGRAPVTKDAIVSLRGGLHQFDHARIGWLVALGQVRDGTHEEARAEGAAPCAVFDGEALARSMEDVGVGLRRVTLPLSAIDVELLESLGGG